jgi:hypothetical protein
MSGHDLKEYLSTAQSVARAAGQVGRLIAIELLRLLFGCCVLLFLAYSSTNALNVRADYPRCLFQETRDYGKGRHWRRFGYRDGSEMRAADIAVTQGEVSIAWV